MIVRTRRAAPARGGAALVELALVMIFILFPICDGILQVGRLILVQQMVSNAAREGCRVASQGVTIQENGSPTQIVSASAAASLPSSPTVRGAAYQSLRASGLKRLTWAQTECSFAFVGTAPAGAKTGATQPWEGVKNQAFEVVVSIPWDAVRWPSLWNGVRAFNAGTSSLSSAPGTKVTYAANWRILTDDKFTVNASVPGANPIP